MPTDQARLWQILLDLQPTIDYLIDLETRVETLEGGGGGGGVTFDWAQVMELTESPWDPDAGGFYANASNTPADGGWLSLKFSTGAADLTVGMLGGDDYIESSITDSSHQSAIDVFSSSGGSSAEWDMRVDSGAGHVVETIRSGNRTAIHREAGSGTVKETLTAAVGQTAPLLDLQDEDGNGIFLVTPAVGQVGASVKHGTTRVDLNAADPDGFPEASIYGYVDNQNYWYLDSFQDVGTPANGYTRLFLKAQTGQTLPLLDLKDENGHDIFMVAPDGSPYATAVTVRGTRADGATKAEFLFFADTDELGTYRESIFKASLSTLAYVTFDAYQDDNTPANSYTTATLRAQVGQTAPLLDLKDENGHDIFTVLPAVDGVTAELYGTSNQAKISMYATDEPNADWSEAQIIGRLSNSAKFYLDTYVDHLDPTNSYTTLYLRALTGQTEPLIKVRDDTNNDIFRVESDGTLTGPGAISKATVHLTGAEIATLHSSPTDIVPAPGAGKVLVPIVAYGEFYPDAGMWDVNTAGLHYSGAVPTVSNVVAASFSGPLGGDGSALTPRTAAATPYGNVSTLAAAANRALQVGASVNDPIPASTIVTKTISSPGVGYAPGDTGNLIVPYYAGAGLATYVVDTVDGGGGVTAATITNHGAGYEQGLDYSTTVTTGGGDGGLGFTVATVDDPGGDLYVTVFYNVIDTN